MNVIAGFPDYIPELIAENCEGGWDYFIGESLTKHLQLNS